MIHCMLADRPAPPKAPRGLLSLKDYTSVHAALELCVYWGVLPNLEPGVGAQDAEARPLPKAVRVHRRLLLWGVQFARHYGVAQEAAAFQLVSRGCDCDMKQSCSLSSASAERLMLSCTGCADANDGSPAKGCTVGSVCPNAAAAVHK